MGSILETGLRTFDTPLLCICLATLVVQKLHTPPLSQAVKSHHVKSVKESVVIYWLTGGGWNAGTLYKSLTSISVCVLGMPDIKEERQGNEDIEDQRTERKWWVWGQETIKKPLSDGFDVFFFF